MSILKALGIWMEWCKMLSYISTFARLSLTPELGRSGTLNQNSIDLKPMNKIPPFHVAIPVYDVELARAFYRDVLGQFVIHYKPKADGDVHTNEVDGHNVPVPHYGVVLEWNDWEALATKLKAHGLKFVIEPYIRFKGAPGEQATMFFLDPCGNALEFKAFKDLTQMFAK